MARCEFDQIILFTHDFPFETGFPTAESYLENEIAILAQHAGEVFVIAHEGFNPEWPLRMNLPDNVRAYGIQDSLYFAKSPEEERRQRHARVLPPCAPIVHDAWKIRTSRARLSAAIDFLQLADAKIAGIDRWFSEIGANIRWGASLLYSFWYNEPVFAMMRLRDLIGQAGAPRPLMICRAHGYDCYDYRSDVGYLPFKGYMAQRLDGVYVCSENGTGYLKERNRRAAKKYRCAHLGTVDCGLGPWVRDGSESRPFTVVCCSRAVPLKRVDRVISALAMLERRGRSIRFFFIGAGPELVFLKEQVALEGLRNAHFLGSLPNKDVLDFYSREQVDLFVNASVAEGIPLSVMEALSFGVPALVTDVGGEREIVNEQFGNGMLITPDFTDDELALAIESIIDLPTEAARKMRVASRMVWETCYSIRPNVESLLESVSALRR